MALSLIRDANPAIDSGDELQPIRVGMVVQQPQPDTCDVISIGLAWLLPEALRPLCSCAGLFFARMNECDEQVELEIAALPHYFDSDDDTYDKHVRTIVLSKAASAQLLDYDRQLASLATCDLRELLEERAAQTAPIVAIAMVEDCKVENGNDEDGEEEEADLVPLPTLFVSRAIIRESLETLHITTSKDRCVQTALLHAILATLSMQMKSCHRAREHRHLKRSYDQVCAVQQWRRQRREKGHGWQRVVTLEESWHQGRAGWDIIVGVPVSQVA